MSALKQQDVKRKADLDAPDQTDAKKPREESAAADRSAVPSALDSSSGGAAASAVTSDYLAPYEERILNGDREASDALKGALKKKTEQAAAWKKLFDEVC